MNTLTLIAQYLYQNNHSDIANQIVNLPDFDKADKHYLKVKYEITNLLINDLLISEETFQLIVSKLSKLSSLSSSSSSSQEFSSNVRISIITFKFLEELIITKNSTNALQILNSLPLDTDLSIRQNLSSLLLSSSNNTPNTYLSSINWKNINNLTQSRLLLVENLFKLLLPNNIYLNPNELQDKLNKAKNYENLLLPKFNPNSLPINEYFKINYHNDEVWFIKYSPNGNYLATGSRDKKIMIFDTLNEYKLINVFKLHSEAITYLSWNSSSTELLSLSFDQILRIWSINSNKCIKELDYRSIMIDSRLSCAKFHSNYEINNEIIIASNDGKLFKIQLFEDKSIKPNIILQFNSNKSIISPQIQDFTIQNNFIYAITLTNELIVFTLDNLKLIYKLQFNQQPISISSVSKSFSGINSNNSYILINLKPNQLIMINTSSMMDSTNDNLPYIETFYYLPNSSSNNYVLRGCAGGDYNPQMNNYNYHSSIVISGGGQNGEIWLWGNEGNVLHCLKAHDGLVNCVDWRGDDYFDESRGIHWASGSDDGKVIIWGV